jgi:uncharacterized protein (DUF1800 family)
LSIVGMRNDERALIAHLLRRAGFGPTPQQLDRYVALGYSGAVQALVDSAPEAPDAIAPPVLTVVATGEIETIEERKARGQLRRQQRLALTQWWLERMVAADNPLTEKMTFFWHGLFATSIDKVNEAALMLTQNDMFRKNGLGKFEPLVQAVAKDPAMMIWLDSNQNRKGSPNENFARELMELFTIGIGSYSDADVKEAARAFTGWRTNRRTGVYSFAAGQADRAPKSILGRTVSTGEEVLSLLATHPAAAKFIAAKLWFKFAAPTTLDSPVVNDLSSVFSSTGGDMRAVMKALFLHAEFVSTPVRQGLVKQPVEYLVGSLRAAGLRPADLEISGPNLYNTLGDLNQVPFDPPSVGGWPGNGYWISTATAMARLRFANALAATGKMDWLSGVAAAQRPDVLANRLGIDGWSATTAAGLAKSTAAPRQQFALALVSPEFVLN